MKKIFASLLGILELCLMQVVTMINLICASPCPDSRWTDVVFLIFSLTMTREQINFCYFPLCEPLFYGIKVKFFTFKFLGTYSLYQLGRLENAASSSPHFFGDISTEFTVFLIDTKTTLPEVPHFWGKEKYWRNRNNKNNEHLHTLQILSTWSLDGKIFIKTSPSGRPRQMFSIDDVKEL